MTKSLKMTTTYYALAMFLLIRVSSFLGLGAFALPNWSAELGATIVLTAAVLVCSFIAGAPLIPLLRIKTPGILLSTAVGTIGCTIAFWLASQLVGQWVTMQSVITCISYAFAISMLVWLLRFAFGTIHEIEWMPTFDK